MTLSTHAAIVRHYANATRAIFGPRLECDDAAAEIAKLLLDLAESTADCADEMADVQREVEQMRRNAEIIRLPKLYTIEGGRP